MTGATVGPGEPAAARSGREDRLTELSIGVGFVTVAVGCLVVAWAVPQGHPAARLAAVAVVVAVFSALVSDPVAAVVTAAIAWLFTIGFLVDALGVLRWHGMIDLVRLGVLVFAALLGVAVGRWVSGGQPADDAVPDQALAPARRPGGPAT